MRRLLVAVVAIALTLTGSATAAAFEQRALGAFEMTTAPGVLPAWSSAGIAINGISPGNVTTSQFASDATITLPVVARAQTANATAGGFRISNTTTGASVRCSIPVVDTRARVIDCLTSAGYNTALFTIESIAERQTVTTSTTRTTTHQGMEIRLSPAGALTLNRELSTTVFTTSVRVGEGSLRVTVLR